MKTFVAGFTNEPKLVRNAKDLADQFDYRYQVADDLSASAYFVKFRQSLFGAGVVLSKPAAGLEASDEAAGSDSSPKPTAASVAGD